MLFVFVGYIHAYIQTDRHCRLNGLVQEQGNMHAYIQTDRHCQLNSLVQEQGNMHAYIQTDRHCRLNRHVRLNGLMKEKYSVKSELILKSVRMVHKGGVWRQTEQLAVLVLKEGNIT